MPNAAFERCTFDESDLSAAQFEGATFIDCTFRDALFTEATTFSRCSFVRTRPDFPPPRCRNRPRMAHRYRTNGKAKLQQTPC
ncbi:pentapeptide repeat-containing protein [Phytoactinopolyspora limicola]|uniref:pentapeptide repeat-containing protein n=1 Tax=Phytoactinopolyspora limicola TaxID=2715536 RepID=UPI0031B5E986